MKAKRNNNLLVVAPHPDDEVLGCGGYLALARQAGRRVRVVVLTDGALGIADRAGAKLRAAEALAGLELLGIGDVEFWNYPDGAVPLSGAIADRLRSLVQAFAPAEILLPTPGDSHSDHRRATRVIIKALAGCWQGQLLFYETVGPQPQVNRVVDITAVMPQKLEALGCHVSQVKQYDYEGNCRALAQLRGIGLGVEYAEGFLEYPWDGEPENFFETRPLVSIVVRGDDPHFLAHSLGSLVSQNYDQLEVILVWHGEGEPDLTNYSFLDIRTVPGLPSRSRNLNLGLAMVRGQYAAFLDQDDILYPQHVELLLAELQGRPEVDVVYSSCRVTACRRQGEQVQVLREERLLNRRLPSGRLLVGNAIPIHALLYRASIFRALRFDEGLEVYEDWEFLARVEATGFKMAHFDAVTCEYRLYDVPEEGEDALHELHARKGYLPWRRQVVERLLARFGAEQFEQLATLVDNQEAVEAEQGARLKEYEQELAALRQRDRQHQAVERYVNDGLRTLGIDQPGRAGFASLLGRSLPKTTLFAIILPVYDTAPELLIETLYSVARQAYPGWQLCLVDDGSSRPDTLELIDTVKTSPEFAGRLFVIHRPATGGIAAATNEALTLATAPYVLFLDHDDLLDSEALLTIAMQIGDQQEYGLFYTDSRIVDRTGGPLHIHHKPDWAPETLLHINYINHLTVVRRDLLVEVGGLRSEFDGSQDWDLLLRVSERLVPEQICHLRQPLYDWRAVETSVSYRTAAKPWAFAAAKRAVQAHLVRLGFEEPVVEKNPHGNGVLCRWRAATPAVEVIVPTHANLDGLQNCLQGLLEETDYPGLLVTVVANRLSNPAMIAHLEALAAEGRIRVIESDAPFNWSALNNRAVEGGESPLVLFMNDDVEVRDRQWLRDMVRYLELPGVGAVGATLLYTDGGVQHNGVRTDPQWVAGNITNWGQRSELTVTRNVAAVTGACLLVARDTYERAGGFDERLAVNYNDIDFCLAVRELGLRIVQATDVRLVHHEMVSRGSIDSPEKEAQWQEEAQFMREKWGERLIDPCSMVQEVIVQSTRILTIG